MQAKNSRIWGKNEKCIIVFTKDRPSIFTKTIQQLFNADVTVIVLDDSTSQETRNVVLSISEKTDNIFYHGKNEQKEILKKLRDVNLNNFITPLGRKGWTLGYARNYAVILSKLLGYKRVLFMDDDIVIKNTNIIGTMMEKLNDADFVGVKIRGMPDYSLVDRITEECNLKLEMSNTLSGGFLAFSLNVISEYFLNYYNEDAVWIYLHPQTKKILEYGEVYQQPYNLFGNVVEKALEQEFGEVLARGIYSVLCKKENSYGIKENNFLLLTRKNFWNGILKTEIEHIKKLTELCKGKDIENIGMSVCSALLRYLSKISPDDFVKVFVEYFRRREIWRAVLSKFGTNGRHVNTIDFSLTQKGRRCKYE